MPRQPEGASVTREHSPEGPLGPNLEWESLPGLKATHLPAGPPVNEEARKAPTPRGPDPRTDMDQDSLDEYSNKVTHQRTTVLRSNQHQQEKEGAMSYREPNSPDKPRNREEHQALDQILLPSAHTWHQQTGVRGDETTSLGGREKSHTDEGAWNRDHLNHGEYGTGAPISVNMVNSSPHEADPTAKSPAA